MQTDYRELLSHEHFEKLIQWLDSPDGESPAFAAPFVSAMVSLYEKKTGKSMERRRSSGPGSSLSLRAINGGNEMGNRLLDNICRGSAPRSGREDAQPVQASTAHTPEQPVDLEGTPPTDTVQDTRLRFEGEHVFVETGTDSLVVASVIASVWDLLEINVTKGRPMSMTLLQTVLYMAYGTALAQRQTRITAEHPQMWQYGPVFPRVYAKMRSGIEGNAADARRMREKDPALYDYIERSVRRGAESRYADFVDIHKAESSPWGRCRKRNGDKWNTVLDDEEVFAWFAARIRRNEKRKP